MEITTARTYGHRRKNILLLRLHNLYYNKKIILKYWLKITVVYWLVVEILTIQYQNGYISIDVLLFLIWLESENFEYVYVKDK